MQLYIVSRDAESLNVFSDAARDAGWAVTQVACGDHLVAEIGQHVKPVLVLIDLACSDVDGFSLIVTLADLKRPVRLRFFANGTDSSVIAARLKATALDLSVGTSIVKPVDHTRFRQVLAYESRRLT